MYFLKIALLGMRKRSFSSFLSVFVGVALLSSGASIGLWAYWLGWEQKNVGAMRTVSVFVDTADDGIVKQTLEKVLLLSGVYTARAVDSKDFMAYLQDHFPDLAEMLKGLGEDVIPRMLEITLPKDQSVGERKEILASLSSIPNVARVDDLQQKTTKAVASLNWLTWGGVGLVLGLWLVFVAFCLQHYQGLIFTDAQEIQLIRSFGATKFWIFLPWLLEALIHCLISSVIAMLVLWFGQHTLEGLYNQFFGTLGFEPFAMNMLVLLRLAGCVFLAACTAHLLGGVYALLRGKVA